MGNELQTKLGRIVISEEVLATIAGMAAVECYGLVGMAARNIKDGLVELLGRENISRGVEVTVRENEISVDLYIIVGYGVKISEVAHNVMEKVKYTIERITGLPVARVNINVQGVKVSKEEPRR
ncbi:MAG TPA: Asp23/Gls24 family envelope stress response protein [Firmicutes bacterium]|nr:Asp23/Gls24 family envelope stress response protein [Bacillota bacterium]